jgi:hypothetical protein
MRQKETFPRPPTQKPPQRATPPTGQLFSYACPLKSNSNFAGLQGDDKHPFRVETVQ